MSVGADRLRGSQGQRGFALLIMLLVLVIGAATVFVSARSIPGDGSRKQSSSRSLSDANAAVTAYAQFGGSNNKPGALVCPDTRMPGDDDAGRAGNHCQKDWGEPSPGAVYLGRLPWRTVRFAGRQSNGEGVAWYAIDGHYQDYPGRPPALNAETPADLEILDAESSSPGATRVAVLILPGDPLPGQNGRPGMELPPGAEILDYVSEYLEGENADGDTVFRDCSGLDDCNDRVIGISRDQLFDLIQHRVVSGVERALKNAEARLGFLPWASAFGDSDMGCEPDLARGRLARNLGDCGGSEAYVRDADFHSADAWITNNEWDELVVYEVDHDCSSGEASCGSGNLTLDGDATYDAVIVSAGRPHAEQVRPGADVEDYLDSETNQANDGIYEQRPLTASDNDVLRGVVIEP